MGKNTKILLGTILVIGGLITITGLTATIQTPLGPMPGVNLPLVLVGFIAIISGGILSIWGFSQRQKVTIPMFTTDTVHGKKIVRTLAMVESHSDPMLGAALAHSSTKKGLENEALKIGANAIVGIKTERLEHKGEVSYYMSGTAVVIED
ncbi:hypothetical protein M1N47_02435 [Dehalococcoidia bacterium]|nr:hypothetical protein [Dehalococcoidia bacterium]